MKAPPSSMRGLINDLTRTLTGTMVHMDDLLLHLNNDSGEFDDAWLANHQLERALEFFIELRSEYMIREKSIDQKKAKSFKLTFVERLMNNFNNILAVVIGYCDMMQNDFADVPQICQSIDSIYKSIQNLHYLINETCCLPERNVFTKNLTLFRKQIKIAKTASKNNGTANNKILLVEDDYAVKKFISMVLRKNKYTVISCSIGEKALAIFEQQKSIFDLCIVDVGLPDIEGPDLVKKLLLQKPHTKILFTSGYNEVKLKEQFYLIGLYEILIKPFRVDELLNKVRSIITIKDSRKNNSLICNRSVLSG
jgi:CheY-like chemotaxis protein